ncbi:hypothetical protein Gotur_035571 [Gossypium turneri]
MEKGFLNKVEDNATIWIWSEKTQQDICQNCEISLASIMVICFIYFMSKWLSTYSELWPNNEISPIDALLLRR